MPLFCVSMLPVLILFAAYTISFLVNSISEVHRNKAMMAALLVIAFVHTDIGRIEHYHTSRDPKEMYRKTRLNNRKCFEETLQDLPARAIVFNCGQWNAVPCMFYIGCTAVDELPNKDQLEIAKSQSRAVYVFDDGQLPEWLVNNQDVNIVQAELIRNGF